MGLAPAILGQLTAIASTMLTPSSNDTEIPKTQTTRSLECLGSLDTIAPSSLDLTGSSGICHDPSSHPQATVELLAHMPAKSVIQDDIRNGNGRFQLVRKRGRSEVWNLFGQILDTVTNVRLPYVACYACKVLYTDTGGGTGNMTRHRCPIGVSYRSSTHGSSTETVEACQHSSFESSISAINRASEQRPALSLTINSESSNSVPLISQNSGEVSIGDVDREVLTDSIVKCCALDLLDPTVFSGKGFRALLDRIWQLSKRASLSPYEIFPDIQMVKSALQTNLRFCMDDLKNELSRTSQGVCLTLETLSYYGRDFRVVHGSRISHDWKWRSNILGVFKARENQSLTEIINLVIHNYELDKKLLRITCSRNPDDFSPIKAFLDVKEKLREVLHVVFSSCTIPVLPMVSIVETVVKSLSEAEIRLPFEYMPCGEDIFGIHKLLRHWNDHYHSIEDIIKSKCLGLLLTLSSINPIHLKDLEEFLRPFQETIDSLEEEQPNFHKVLPEWFALMHECHSSDEEYSPLLKELKQRVGELLVQEKSALINVEHLIAAILNPRLNRKLSMICTDQERLLACDRIRLLCGIRTQHGPLSGGNSFEGEPHRKRRMFLNSLEDDPVGDDELECYMRSQYPSNQTKDVIAFWCSVGQSQFPSLASLARRILSVPATTPKTIFDKRQASVAPDQLHTFLMLRSMFDTEREE